MSNIERKYSYLDEGVFPEVGEYGVTYLTLYSSGAGNVYDGWMWDPDRVHYSETERTFGYRNPDYPDYCWDDEVVVDLSNAQTRQETSDFAQGRITSFNTNVSNRPIVLQDIDITGLDEEEREALATTVLFSAIPLVKDAYIQAMVEVQMKVNLSLTNTNGMVRVEAFYILNDESDRTMRPNPVHTFAVSTANERHTLPWLYWNPALKHEDNNYIGVKLLCTGGTAEIGISDDPEYGDAMITLTSAGLTGDHIDSGHPVSLDIYGKSMVPPNYKLKESDYTVLCTYDTGEVYEVTRLCEFTPPMGTKVIDPVTTLTANYQGLTASMSIVLAQLENIELIGLTDFYEDTYTLNRDDYVVMAYYDTGDIMDITDDEELIFDPPMGTVINEDTTLTATYSPEYMHGSEFEDSLEIVKHTSIARGSGPLNGLIYNLYDNNVVEITGNADVTSGSNRLHEYIALPDTIKNAMINNSVITYTLKWNAEGDISGFYLPGITYSSSISSCIGMVQDFIDFSEINIVPYYDQRPTGVSANSNPVIMYFCDQVLLSDSSLKDVSFLGNITYKNVSDLPVPITNSITNIGHNADGQLSYCFQHCSLINNNFLSNWDMTYVTNMTRMFMGSGIIDLDSLSNWNTSLATDMTYMFKECNSLENIEGLRNWDISKVTSMVGIFEGCSKLEDARSLSSWDGASLGSVSSMFFNSGLKSLSGLGQAMLKFGSSIAGTGINQTLMLQGTKITNLYGLPTNIFTDGKFAPAGLFMGCPLTSLSGASNLDLSESTSMEFMFNMCLSLADVSDCQQWDVSNITNFRGAFGNCNSITDLNVFSGWDLSSAENARSMFYASGQNNTIRYTSDQINSYSCSPSLFINYSDVLSDSKIFAISKDYSEENDIITLRRAHIDQGSKEYYTVAEGMFGGRDILDLVQVTQQPITYRAVFVNPDATPSWYRTRIENYINNNHFKLDY